MISVDAITIITCRPSGIHLIPAGNLPLPCYNQINLLNVRIKYASNQYYKVQTLGINFQSQKIPISFPIKTNTIIVVRRSGIQIRFSHTNVFLEILKPNPSITYHSVHENATKEKGCGPQQSCNQRC